MNWLVVALIAHFLFALVFLLDKFILARPIRHPLVYAFYPGFLGILIVLLIPFIRFQILAPKELFLSFLSGALFIWALIYFYTALQRGEASRIVPIVGALVALTTFLFSGLIGVEVLHGRHVVAFILLVFGSFLITWGHRHKIGESRVMGAAVAAALLFGISFVFTKEVFQHTDFFSGFIWTRVGGFLFSMLLLSRSSWRAQIFTTTRNIQGGGVLLFFTDKVIGSAALILQFYAISLGSVILVNALQSIQYVFLLIFAAFLSIRFPRVIKETFGVGTFFKKFFAILIIGVGLTLLLLPVPKPQPLSFGITFSQKFAQELGLDWQKTYSALLDELGIRDLRLIAYWDRIEPEEGKFDFRDLDWQIEEAEKHGARVNLVVGRKVPRWPECHEPEWIREDIKNQKLHTYIETTTQRYKNRNAVWAWQVENEPLFPFGPCKPLGLKMIKEEVALVRSLDSRPIILTDSGELGFAWPLLMREADIFGTTLYRYVHNKTFGYLHYWFIPSSYFRFKSWLATDIFKKQALISELQAEPWETRSLAEAPLESQYKTMNPEIFREVIDYARHSGFPRAYLWGAEWWYWLREKRDNLDMWNEAKRLFEDSSRSR